MTMKATITAEEFEQLIPRLKMAFYRTVELTANEVHGNVKEFSPVDHGRLRGSWFLKQNSPQDFMVYTSTKYALVHNDGCDPYMIYPRVRRALRFYINGREIFAASVLHPGFNPTHYIDGAIAAAENRIDDFVHQALKEGGLI